MNSPAPAAPAPRQIRRGDLGVVITPTSTSYQGRATEHGVRVALGLVSSIKRDGSAVNRVDSARYTAPEWEAKRPGRSTVTTVSAERLDVTAALSAYAARRSDFSSIDEAKEFVRSFRRA